MAVKLVKRYDFMGTITMDAQKTSEGFLKARAPITKCGVFPYTRPDGTTIRELRHPNEVFKAKALKSMELMAIQEDHKAMLDATNTKALKVGHVGQEIEVDSPYVYANLVVDTAEGVDAIEKRSKSGLSCGYMCMLMMQSGTYEGQAYDAVQTDIDYNHLALCETPRLGSELAIQLDAEDAIHTEGDAKTAKRLDSNKEIPMVKVTINGIVYDAAPEVANELARINKVNSDAVLAAGTKDRENQEAMDALKTKLEKERDAAQAKADGLDATNKELKAKVDAIPASIADSVKARVALERTAAKVLPDAEFAKVDSMTNAEIKAAVIKTRNAKLDLTGKSEAYVDSAFDFATANLDEDAAASALAESRKLAAPKADNLDAADSQDAARKRMTERLQNGGKLLEKKT